MAHQLSGRYELTALIGRGPNGAVWRARELGTRETLAVKLLDGKLSGDPHTVDRFLRERHVLTAFLHLAYVRVRDLIAEDGVIALVMELVTGTDMQQLIDRSGPLTAADSVVVATTIAEALAAAHDAGVVHCDLKPSNVLIEEDSGQVRLTDIRVARLARGYLTGVDRFTSPEYAAPEVIRGGPPVPATDVYALGLLLMEMLTSTTPFHGAHPDEVLEWHLKAEPVIPRDVPSRLRRLIEDCVHLEPAWRPTARQVSDELRRVLPAFSPYAPGESELVTPPSRPVPSPARTPQPVVETPAEPPQPGRRARPGPLRRQPAGVRLAALVGALVLAAGAVVFAVLGLSIGDSGGQGSNAAGTTVTGAPTAGTRPSAQGGATVAAPQQPASAQPHTLEGATAFVYYWFNALDYAVATGNTASLAAASSPNCKTCGEAIGVIQAGYSNGGSLRGGQYTLRDAKADGFWNIEKPLLHVVFDRTPRSAVSADGGTRGVLDGATFATCQIYLERIDNRWRVVDVSLDTKFI
jgi:serine/threonine-protein kinase